VRLNDITAVVNLLPLLIITIVATANAIAIVTPILRAKSAISSDILSELASPVIWDASEQAISTNGITIMAQILAGLVILAVLAVGLVAAITVVILKDN
jgi:hypothetical protein